MNGDVREITLDKFFEECKAGTMTKARGQQIIGDVYKKGWDDRNALQVKANNINRKTRKEESDTFKDALNDVCAAVAAQTEVDVDYIRNYIINIVSSNVVTYLNNNNIKITDKDLDKIAAVSVADIRNAICERIENIDETLEKYITSKEFEAKQNTLF